MAEYQITYWRDIPSMVMAREGRQNRTRVELPQRFQVAIDEAAMRLDLVGTDAYTEEFHRTNWEERAGSHEDVAYAVAAELEAQFTPQRIREILRGYGGNDANSDQDASDSQLMQWLQEGRILLSDGAMGTMLFASGLTDGGAPELWNVTNPDKVKAVYQAYVDAGSNIICTNTFGGTSARLKMHNLQDRVIELNRAGVQLAREVADKVGVLVAGSVGPSGELIEPVGPLSIADAQAIFAEQIQGLVEGGVDLILVETMSHLNEVIAAAKAARQVAPHIPLATTMSFDTNLHTMMGVSPREAVEQLARFGVKIIGANCGNGSDDMAHIATQLAQYRPEGVYLMVQSNSGLPQYADGKIVFAGTPEVMADYAKQMRNLGINIIGACCGSTPAHIAAMRNALDATKDQPIAGPPPIEEASGAIESAESRAARAAARRAERRQRVEA
ncbi:MAG: betaine--homocysteine S-methyltransferase [Caldilineaceae bacterium]